MPACLLACKGRRPERWAPCLAYAAGCMILRSCTSLRGLGAPALLYGPPLTSPASPPPPLERIHKPAGNLHACTQWARPSPTRAVWAWHLCWRRMIARPGSWAAAAPHTWGARSPRCMPRTGPTPISPHRACPRSRVRPCRIGSSTCNSSSSSSSSPQSRPTGIPSTTAAA